MDAGQSAANRAASASRAGEHLRRKADAADAAAAKYQRGFEGEQRLAEWLAPLETIGFRLLADCSVPGAVGNIDLLAIGPPGVFVIDAKNWSGKLEVRGSEVLQNGRRRRDVLHGLDAQAVAVDRVLRSGGASTVPIWPVLAFVGEASIAGYQLANRAYVTGGRSVVDLLRSAAPVLDSAWIEWAHAALARACPPRTALLDGEATPPEEHVVFLTPWFKYGKRRIYARDEVGTDGGYLDLLSGDVVGESPVAAQVLGQLLPHYLSDLEGAGLTDDDTAGVQTFLASRARATARAMPLVVGYVWRKGGLRRLYVSRLTTDSQMLSMGWYDLEDGRTYSQGDLNAEVRFCGQTYQSVEQARIAAN